MPTAEQIKQRIETAIPGASAEVEDYTGTGDHFRATVSAPQFAGVSRIGQHRLVYEVFGEEIGGPIHALSLKTQAATAPLKTQTTPVPPETHAAPLPSKTHTGPPQGTHATPMSGAGNVS